MANDNSALRITVPYKEIKAFCERWGLTKMEVFGSAIRSDFNPETSDIDLMVSRPSPPTVRISLFDEVKMCDELAEIFGRKVDLVWRSSIETHYNKVRRKSILEHTETIYVSP